MLGLGLSIWQFVSTVGGGQPPPTTITADSTTAFTADSTTAFTADKT